MRDLERRQRRLDRAGLLIRLELTIAFAATLLVGFWFINDAGVVWYQPASTPVLQLVFPWAGIVAVIFGTVGVIFGLVWMVRLARMNPDAGERTWRYRDV